MKPPVGATPRYVIDAQRFDELAGAVERFACENERGDPHWFASPELIQGWLAEMQEIVDRKISEDERLARAIERRNLERLEENRR